MKIQSLMIIYHINKESDKMKITESFIKKDIEGYGLSQFYTEEGMWSITDNWDGTYNIALFKDDDAMETHFDYTMEKVLERVNAGIN